MTDKVDLVPIYKLVEIISYSNDRRNGAGQSIYKLVEIISYSNVRAWMHFRVIYKLVEIISYSNKGTLERTNNLQISRNYKLFKLHAITCFLNIYKLVEIISYSNCDQFPDCDSYLQISRNYKLFKQIVWGTMWRKIYKLVEIISYSNEAQSKRHYLSTN